MKHCIVDASVALKWIFSEENAEAAQSFLNEIESAKVKVIVPELFYCEIANACWMRVKRNRVKSQEAAVLFDQILRLPFERRLDSEFVDVALENAIYYNISAYDGLYAALAETYQAPLITADIKLIRACRAKKFRFIESLEERETL